MNVSLCLIIKNENSYLQEWLDYHILLGVDHFWIYDNESSINVKDTVAEYINSGWVTVHSIKGSGVQLYAYDHCLQTYGHTSRWIGFIDTDEFVVLHKANNLPEFLQKYEAYAGLAISSLFFGPGGNKTRPSIGQVAGYRFRTPEKLSVNRFIKSFVQPSHVIYPISPHSFLYREGEYCVNESGLRVDAQRFPCHVEQIQVNHYYTRSEEEWFHKLTRGRGDTGDPYSDERWKEIEKFSTISDSSAPNLAKKLISQTKKKVGGVNLVQAMHRKTKQMKSVPINLPASDEIVTPRKEIVDYYDEFLAGTNLLTAGNLTQAKIFFASQINKFPFDVIRYTNFAAICIQLKDFDNAWPALAQAWRMAPQSLYVLLGMIDYFYAVGNFPQVEKIFLLVEAQGNLEPISVAIKALALWKQDKIEEAALTAQKILPRLQENDLKNPHFKELFDIFSKK